MTNIVERLRHQVAGNDWPLRQEAADEIERLWADKAAISQTASDYLHEIEMTDTVERHHYRPSTLHMGDCDICGHLQNSELHIGYSTARAEIERLQADNAGIQKVAVRFEAEAEALRTEVEQLRERVKMLELLTQTMVDAAIDGMGCDTSTQIERLQSKLKKGSDSGL